MNTYYTINTIDALYYMNTYYTINTIDSLYLYQS